jgi:hypothetical protein
MMERVLHKIGMQGEGPHNCPGPGYLRQDDGDPIFPLGARPLTEDEEN